MITTSSSYRKRNSIYPWVVVALLWGVGLLNYMDRQMLSTMKPAMQLDIHELRYATNFGYLMSIFLWVYALASPFSGAIADRVNRKWLIVFSLFVWSAVTCAMGYAKTYEQLYWLRALMGLSEALYIPAGLALIADYHSSKTRSLAIGVHMTGLYLGQALGGFGAIAAAHLSWQTTFRDFGFIGIAYSLLLIIALKEKRSNEHESAGVTDEPKGNIFQSMASLLSKPAFWVILLVFAIPSLPGWAAKNWLPTLFAQNLHVPMTEAGPWATITIASSSLIGVVIGGVLSDRWVQSNIRARVYTSAVGLLLTIPGLLFLGIAHSFFTSTGAAVCFGLGFGMFDVNNMPILCQFVPTRMRAAGYGLMNMTGILCGALITSLLGQSTDAGHLGMGFATLAAAVLATVCVQLLFLKPKADGNG
ncbi:MAG: MFS transporter [Bacteroidetes bacterium]|nr:MFS transporter [Bacteroidota bacterium]